MWPGLWIVSLVPLLAFVTTVDALSSSSLRLGQRLHIRAEWLLIAALGSILGCLIFFLDLRLSSLDFTIYGWLGRHTDKDPVIWGPRHLLENWLLLMDVVLVFFSLPVVVWMALRRQRPVHLWLLLGVLGTYGAIVWLALNGRATERSAAEKTA